MLAPHLHTLFEDYAKAAPQCVSEADRHHLVRKFKRQINRAIADCFIALIVDAVRGFLWGLIPKPVRDWWLLRQLS
jgi:hypothetical protein